jgi:hypothetical protein
MESIKGHRYRAPCESKEQLRLPTSNSEPLPRPRSLNHSPAASILSLATSNFGVMLTWPFRACLTVTKNKHRQLATDDTWMVVCQVNSVMLKQLGNFNLYISTILRVIE